MRALGRTRRDREAKEWRSCPAGICSLPRKRNQRLSLSLARRARSREAWPAAALSRVVSGGQSRKVTHRFIALAIWFPDKTLAKTCADFSDLAIGPDGSLYLLSDQSCTIVRLDNLPAGGGTAALLNAWRLDGLDGKPEGLAFTAQGQAVVGLDTRKPRQNLVLLEPAVAPPSQL